VSESSPSSTGYQYALRIVGSQFQSLLQTTGSAVVCLAPDHSILTWNRGAETIFGYAADEVVGKNYFDLFLPPEHRAGVASEISKVISGGVTRGYENSVRTRTGSERMVLWNAARLVDEHGEPFAVVAIGQDVTALHQAQMLQAGESRVLKLLVKGGDMASVLEELAATIESAFPEVRCAVMTVDTESGRLRCAAAPSLDEDYRRLLDGIPIGQDAISCGRAADLGKLVLSLEIDTEPQWSAHRQPAILSGLRGCWSQPVFTGSGSILGTFDTYTLRSRRPTEAELESTGRAAQLAGIVIEHKRVLEQRFRESEDRYQTAVVELESLRQEVQKRFTLDDMVAVSPAMLEVIQMAARVAPTDATVLITGETGTGKEVLARAIHTNSGRSQGPFIAVNCGAIPETLMESELFGHERGAFTGADRRKVGQIDRAAGGTLFLDEVGELIPSAQVKLLRVLQQRTYERLGGVETLRADVRIITATNRDISAEVSEGSFREDLFYRLNVFHIHIPPLRERREAIPLLAERILERIATDLRRPEIALSKSAMQAIQEYNWKGNVRELQNALERAAILCGGSLIGPDHLPIQADPVVVRRRSGAEDEIVVRLEDGFSMEKLEQRLVRQALKAARGNKSKAARLLGISRGSLRWKLQK
jgi:PAS domain S-box-containing protein